MIAVVIAALAVVSVAMVVYSLTRPRPYRVHLSWQEDPRTTVTVMWWTTREGEGRVRYGENRVSSSVSSVVKGFEGGYLHTAQITGLSPGVEYRYTCGASGERSPVRRFQTAPAADVSQSFSFSFFADSRTQPEPRRLISQGIAKADTDFVLGAGDYVANGNDMAQWEEWFQDMGDALVSAPFMAVLGNHEENSPLYYDQFSFPNGEEYYSFDYGNAHFVGLNTEIPISNQTDWLRIDLARARSDPSITWIIAFFHQPIFTASSHEGRGDLAEAWGPIMDEYHVDLVMVGHNHCYERTSAMLSNGTVTDRGQNLIDPRGTVHITSAGAGAPLYETKPADFIEHGRSHYHFLLITVDGNLLQMEAIRDTGRVLDSLTIRKTS